MKIDKFIDSLKRSAPPSGISVELVALWHDKNGQWDIAHELIQYVPGNGPARLHAYLHRKEGDIWNANYWYLRSDDTMPETSLDAEWEFLVSMFTE